MPTDEHGVEIRLSRDNAETLVRMWHESMNSGRKLKPAANQKYQDQNECFACGEAYDALVEQMPELFEGIDS